MRKRHAGEALHWFSHFQPGTSSHLWGLRLGQQYLDMSLVTTRLCLAIIFSECLAKPFKFRTFSGPICFYLPLLVYPYRRKLLLVPNLKSPMLQFEPIASYQSSVMPWNNHLSAMSQHCPCIFSWSFLGFLALYASGLAPFRDLARSLQAGFSDRTDALPIYSSETVPGYH